MARLYKRGRVWWAAGEYNGKRWQKSTRQHGRKAAQRVALEIEYRIAHSPDTPTAKKLSTGLEELIAKQVRADLSEATTQITVQKGRHLRRVLGPGFNLHDLTQSTTAAYADLRISETASRHTVFKELKILRQACKAVGVPWSDDLMPDLGKNVYTPRKRWLPIGEYRRLMMALNANRRDYVAMWCNTGMRKSELFKLTTGHLDMRKRLLHVPGTKTEKAERIVAMNPVVLEVVRRRRALVPMFPEWGRGNIGRDLNAACKRAQIAPASPNDFRRTFASWAAQNGVSMFQLKDIMGHSSTAMLEQVYAQLGTDVQYAIVDALPSCSSIVANSMDSMDSTDYMDSVAGEKPL